MSSSEVRNTCVQDVDICKKTCDKMPGVTFLGTGKHRSYDGQYSGVGVKLPGWHNPIVFDTKTGKAILDNYNGSWGHMDELNKFLAGYAEEYIGNVVEGVPGASIESTETLSDGNVKIVIDVPDTAIEGGGAGTPGWGAL
jgi:hypothetical protein